MTMKFSVFALAALSAATSTSSRYIVAATASRKRKITKKGGSTSGSYGATGPTNDDTIPIGDTCDVIDDNCAIPLGLDHGVCVFNPMDCSNRYGYWTCQSGQPGAFCVDTSDCVVPPGLEHPVCRVDGFEFKCQSGQTGSLCGQTSDCVPIAGLNPPRAVCRNYKCQSGRKGDYCGQDKDCLSGKCKGVTGIAECK